MAVRSRPRANLKEDLGDEVQLWHSIVDKIRRCAALTKEYDEVYARIPEVENKIAEADPMTTLPLLEELSQLHRDGLKLAEDERKILLDEPEDLIKNLETLISVRTAFENDLPSSSQRSSGHMKSSTRNLKRRIEPDSGVIGAAGAGVGPVVAVGGGGGSGGSTGGAVTAAVSAAPSAVESPALTPETIGTPVASSAGGGGGGPGGSGRLVAKLPSRSGSVAATAIKSEPLGDDGIKSVAHDKYNQLKVGTQVFLRNKDKKSDGEGILCSLTSVLGDGKTRRYEVQDPEPDESGHQPAPYKALLSSLEPIPPTSAFLPDLPKGKQVIAVYPDTSTFYRAEVVGGRGRELCRLRFEGEEERDKEMDVERRLVLDVR